MSYRRAKKRHIRLGRRGESLTCKLLKEKNYDILCRNYKVKSGEIDIVARDGGVLVFVEVKTRRSTTWGRPAANLKFHQRQRIARAAKNYLRSIGNPTVVYRFDLVEVILSDWQIHEIKHWPEHFSGSGLREPTFAKFDYT